MTEILRDITAPDWNYYGVVEVGILAEDIPVDSLLYQLAQQVPGRYLRIYISNLADYPGAVVEPDGSHNFTTVPADLQGFIYIDGIQYPINYSLQSNLTFWPTSLPDGFLIDGYRETGLDPALQDIIDYGPDISRRRTYLHLVTVQGSIRINRTQLDDLETFYYTTLQYGSLAFHWINPITGETSVFRFNEPYDITLISNNMFSVSLNLLQRDYV